MALGDAVEDAAKSVVEANILPIGIAENLANIDDDPAEAITGLVGTAIPSVAVADAMYKALTSTEPNISGAGGFPILAAALSTLKQLREVCGTGEPDQGGDFVKGIAEFQQIGDEMSTAHTPGTWQGAASEAYGLANNRQKERANKMADADAKVQKAVAFEAVQVAVVRKTVDDGIRTVNGAIPIATFLASIPKYGDALSYSYQIAAASGGLEFASPAVGDLFNVSKENAAHVNMATGLYSAIGADNGSAPSGAGGQLKVVTADLQQVSEIQDQVGSKIEAASQTTSGTPANVLETHGTACASMSAALSQAVAARTAAATSMRIRSQRLSDGLQTAVTKYDATDRQGGEKIQGSMLDVTHP